MELPVLSGLKIVSFSHVIAGPMAGSMLADFGAQLVHVEPPGKGDPAREMGFTKEGTYLWWKVLGRNKRSVTLDLRKPEARPVARRLIAWADAVVVNMRPETLIRWGLDFDQLRAANPKIVVLQISGFGRDGPRANEPGFGKGGEARSGVVRITGFPDGPPTYTAFALGDTVTGLMGAFAIMAAIYRRDRDPDFRGELIDIALYEPLFRLIDWQVILHDQLGMVFERFGNRMPVAPAAVANIYKTRDGEWISVTSGTAAAALKVVDMLGLPREEFDSGERLRERAGEIDTLLHEWFAERDAAEVLEQMKKAEVVATPIFSISDIMQDEVYRHRKDIITVEDRELGPVKMQATLPQFVNHPGEVWRTGPVLGEDNDLVYRDWLGFEAEEYHRLRQNGII
jgi:crotonobetainyl-CoA:carnitine CoA-transferase CaiB-like acyl-CoA transferase